MIIDKFQIFWITVTVIKLLLTAIVMLESRHNGRDIVHLGGIR